MAVRSPGSALKPFIYAMAFADGIAAPDTVVPDLPRRFGGYAPENFDRGFAGSITAADALRRSLNLPAVALLDRVGPLRFAATLRAAGAALRLPQAAPIRRCPWRSAVSASRCARPPDFMPLWRPTGPAGRCTCSPTSRTNRPDFLPAPAAHLVADVLTRPLPAFGPQGIAWKTGTSWGGRDAWAFGFDSRHVVAVWIGRPDGTPLPGATGTSLALPQLARVFDLLPKAPRTVQPLPAQHTSPATVAAEALRLLFPPTGAVLSADGPVTIRVMGGRRPLTFLVDGAPLPTDRIRRDVAWQPAGPGFYRLTVLDADGAAVRAAVQVRISP